MAEFVTKAENQRRMITLITCIIICTLSIVGIIYSIKAEGDLRENPKSAKTIKLLTTKIEDTRGRIRNLEASYVEFSGAVGWRTFSPATHDRFPSGGVSGEQLKIYLDYWVKELAKYDQKNFKQWYGPEGGGTNELKLTDLFNTLGEVEAAYRGKNTTLVAAIAKAEEDAKAAMKSLEETEKKNLEDIDKQLKEDYKRLLKDLGTKEKQHGEELAALQVESETKIREHTELKNRNLQEQTRLENRKAELMTRINWITYRREEAKERKEPDGVILAVDGKYNVAWIDLVHADRIWTGSRFKVYSLEKGGSKVDKGEIEVILVRAAESSKVAIIKTLNAEEPIKPGDKIYNEFYEKGKTRYIAIAGRLTGKLSNEEAGRKIREFGDMFQEKVDERTNYVVVGEGYETHPNYEQANELGVKLLLERHLYDYLGVP